MTGVSAAAAQEPAWSGLGRLREIADGSGHPPRGGTRVDLGVLSARDGILIVGPTHSLPVTGLATFLDAGGRLALLDDFGSGRALLRAYQIGVTQAPDRDAVRIRDNPDLLVAHPAVDHPLTQRVASLLTNRAVALRHDVLRPVFTFAETESAVVLAGAVGAGRLVAVGDASLLINQQLVLPDQQQFAENLVSYLTASGGELWLIGPEQELYGTFGRPHRPGIDRVDSALSRLSHPDLPLWLVMGLALGAVAAATVWMVGSLPRVTPYLTPDSLPSPRVWAGFAGRVESARHDGHNLLWAALDYRSELIAHCARALNLDEPPDRRVLLAAAERAGRPAAVRKTLSELLAELDALAAAEEQQGELPRVDPAQLCRVVTTGERLLSDLEMRTT